jgi:hypothetical protein
MSPHRPPHPSPGAANSAAGNKIQRRQNFGKEFKDSFRVLAFEDNPANGLKSLDLPPRIGKT